MIADGLALILAGGDSQRMGCDKATLRLGEKTLLQRVVDVVQPLFPELLVSLRQPRADIEWPQIIDPAGSAGPLAGLCAGLEQAQARRVPWVFAVATDMPFVQAALIRHLATLRDGFQVVVPVVQGYPQPLASFYSIESLDAVRTTLSGNGKRSLRALLEQLKVRYVDEDELRTKDPGLRSFFDLDTPQDIAVARQSEESE